MRVAVVLGVCACALLTSIASAAGSHRSLAQVTSATPLQVNATFIGISTVSNADASAIRTALNESIATPKPSEVVVSSSPAAKLEEDRVTLVILVYPKSSADTAQLQSQLEANDLRVTWLQSLQAAGLNEVDNIQVNSVTLQSSVNPGGKPVTGTSLLGVLAVIIVGAILIVVAALFGVRSLLQIRDLQAKAKAGYATVELSDPHQNMETGLPRDASPHSRSGSPDRGARPGTPTRSGKFDDSKLH